jgi:hypothetical protein
MSQIVVGANLNLLFGATVSSKNADRLQAGGTAIVIAPSLQNRCSDKGHDLTGLGRWVWTRIQGTSDFNTSIFSAYRPCVSSISDRD